MQRTMASSTSGSSSATNDECGFGEPSFRVQEISQCAAINPGSVVPLQTGNFLLINSNGQVYHTQNGSTKPLADFNFSIQMAYCNDCVILISKHGLAFRYILNSDYLPLRELSQVSMSDNQCFVEITREETGIWSNELKYETFYPCLIQFSQKCQQRLDESMNDDEYLIVEVEDARGLAKDLVDFYQHYVGAQIFDTPLLSYASILLDKLRLFIDPYAPYDSSNSPRFTEEAGDPENLAHYSVMNSEAARRLSFYKWHRTDCLYATPKSLAAAGFFHRPTSANLDRVACFTCSVCLVNWEVQDDPVQEHLKHGQNCRFIQKTDLQNIPYETTLSNLPLYKWSSICEKPDLQLDPNNLIVGQTVGETIWIAVAAPSPSISQQNKPSIFLFDTSKVAGRPIEILLDLYATCMANQMNLVSSNEQGKRRSFDWLNSVESDVTSKESLCEITALCTTTTFDECTITLRGEKIVGILCTAVSVDENRLKSMQSHEDSSDPNNIDQANKRRPFILVHHIVEFPDDNHVLAIDYANAWNQAWASSSAQNKFENFYAPNTNWTNDISPVNESPIDALVLYDDKSDSYAEITKETPKPTNEEVFYNPMNTTNDKPPDPDHLPIYYNEKTTAAIGIQSVRLPSEYDSTEYKIDCIVSSSSGNLVIAAINQQTSQHSNEDVSSAIIVYAWVPMLHLLQETPISKIPFKDGKKIKTVHLLGKDYFVTTALKRENALSTEALNDTACLLFDDGSLLVVDLDFGHSVKIDVPLVKSVSLTNSDEICALTVDNKLINIEVKHSMPSLNKDVTEELAISFLSAAEKSNLLMDPNVCLNEKLRKLTTGSLKYSNLENILQKDCQWCLSPMEQLAFTWSLTRAEPLTRSHHTMNSSVSSNLPTSPLFNSRSHPMSQQAQLQSNLGLTVQTPHEFVEFNLHSAKERNASNPTILTTTTCQQFCVLNKIPYSELVGLNIDASRTWQIRPRRESTKKSFVFELSLMFGLNLSHVNLTFGLAGFVRGLSDIQISLYIPRKSHGSLSEEAAELFADPEQPILAGPGGGFAVENYLGMLSSKPHLLEQKFDRCMGPMSIAEFADVNGKQAKIQLSVVQLLLSAARSKLDASNKEMIYEKDWMFRPQRFYVHVEVNERRTVQQKAYQAALQNSQTDHQRRELFQSIGGGKRSRMTTSAGGHIPLPYKTSSDRKKQQMKGRSGSSRKRCVHVSSLIAENVTMTALKPYTSGDANKNETILSCFEYLTVSAFKAAEPTQSKVNMQRCLFALDTHAHSTILKLAVGILTKENDDLPYYRVLIAQQQALDVLSWLLTQWRVSRDLKRINALSSSMQELLPDLINNCFVVAPRTIARKTSAILIDLLNLTSQNTLTIQLLQQITTVFATKRFHFSASFQWFTIVVRFIVKNACLQSNMNNDQLLNAVVDLNRTCTQLIQNTGKIWRSRRSTANSMLKLGDTTINLESLDEIHLYDSPSLLALLIVDPTLIATAHNNARLAFSTFKNATSNFVSKNDNEVGSSDSGNVVTKSFFEGAIQFEPSSSSFSTHTTSKSRGFGSKQPTNSGNGTSTEQSKDAKWLNDSTALATIYLLDELDENEIKWHEHLGINSLEAPTYPTKKSLNERANNNPLSSTARPQTAHGTSTQSTSQSQASTTDSQQTQLIADLLTNKQSKVIFDELCNKHGTQNVHRFLMGSEQMPGLDEVERLRFNVLSASCQLRILDLNASTAAQISADLPQMTNELSVNQQSFFGFPSSTTASGTKTLSTPTADISIDPTKQAFVPAQSTNLQSSSSIESRGSQLKSAAEIYLLERHRAILEKSQGPTIADKLHALPPPMTNPFVAFAPTVDETQQLHTDNNLSGTLIAFDDMESDERLFATDDMFGTQMDASDDNTLVHEEDRANEKKSINGGAFVLAKKAPMFLMEIESCQSGQQLVQIVLDFNLPFLLTDLLIPANELFSAIAVDGWLDEKHSSIRLAYSTEIENRSLVLNDLTPGSLIRYIRLSFTTRDCRRIATSFMLGQFWGTRFASPWQLYQSLCEDVQTDESNENTTSDPYANALKLTLEKQELNFNELDTLVSQLFSRYRNHVAQLKKNFNKRTYQKCLTDRQLYNNLRTIIDRSQLDMQPASLVFKPQNSTQNSMSKNWFGHEKPVNSQRNTDSWRDATSSELRFVSIEFMVLANEIHDLLALNQQSVNRPETITSTNTSIPNKLDIEVLDLEAAVRLFGCFICDSDTKLQAICCGFLFHHGSRTSWWADFFPAVIKRHFVAGSSDSLENIFILLAYICDQSVRHHELHTPIVEKLLSYIQELISSPKTINGSVDTTQLSWLLLLLSTAFDIIVPNTKHTDRWSFISGNTCTNYPQAPMPNENFRRYTRKMGSVSMKDQFWSHHYHNAGGFVPASSFSAINGGQFIDTDPPPPMFSMPSYQKYSSSAITSALDHAAVIELKKLGNEIRQIGKQIETMLSSNQLNSDDFTPLKKEQKNLASLYTTAQAYIYKSPSCIHDGFLDKVIGGLENESMKAPLASHEEDFMLNGDENVDAATKKQQQLEASNANNIRNRLTKVRKSLYLLVKQTKNASKTKSLNNSTTPRARRFAVRMHLPQQTVIGTIKLLIKLMIESNSMLSPSTQVLVFKVCAKLSVHGCRHPISFRQMMESVQTTQNLLAVVIENSTSWVLHALTSFLLDISEAENPTVSSDPSTSAMDFEEHSSSSPLIPKETDSLAAKSAELFNYLNDTSVNVEPMEEGSPNADKKRRKEDVPIDVDNAQSSSAVIVAAIVDDKDMSPMEEETATTSTSTFVTNIDDEDTLCEAKSAMNSLSIVSPTLIASGLVNEQTFVAGSDLNSISEERELHMGLMGERNEVGDSPQYPFTFTLFDKPNESDVDMLILMALFALKPIEKKNPNYWDNYRSWFLRQIGFAVSRARYERGEPLNEIFRWLDYVMGAELEAANNSKSENAYIKWGLLSILHASDFIEREFDLNGKKLEIEKSPSHSALLCGSYFSQFYCIHDNANNADMDEDPLLDLLDDKFNDVFAKLLISAKGGNEEIMGYTRLLSSIIEQKRVGNSDQPDEQLSNQVAESQDQNTALGTLAESYLAVDSSEDAAQLVAMRGFLPLHKTVFIFSKLRFLQSLVQVERCVKNLGFAYLPEPQELQPLPSAVNNKKNNSGEKRHKSMAKAKQAESLSDSSSAEKLRTADAVMDELMQYNVKMSVNFLNTRSCPINLGFDASSNLDICISNAQRRLLAERLTATCHSLHKMAPTLERKVKTSTIYERVTPGIETCATLVVDAVNSLFSELNVQKANELPARTHRNGGGQFLSNLINFFWDFQGNIIANRTQSNESINVARNFVLDEKAISNLLRFAVEYEQMTEQIWLHLLKILNALDTPIEDALRESKSYKFTQWIENSPYFAQFIERFFNSSVGRFSMVSSTRSTSGPAIQNVFGRFVQTLFKQISSRTMDNILTVLTKVIRNSREYGFVNLPIEMITELTASFDKMDRVCQCTPSVFAQFMQVLMEFTSDFFIEVQRIHRHFPDEALQQHNQLFTTDLQSIPSNVCFSAVLSSSSVRERNMSTNERLRIYNGTSSATKNTKNIAFVKRADLLENSLRDGDVATKDLFITILYSLLRLCVRYISQYKPQVIKAIIQEQPKTLTRGIDMLFTFVSHTNNIDDITVENFKVVTLSDAVIHLLLVISETSTEDTESCRLFIRFVINLLRNRVSSTQSTEQGGESKTTLMDLPLPVLLLIKSLLSSVNRCQIFVDEDGHTFVADQLQRSLDSISNDWPTHTNFLSITSKLNALASNIAGVEFMNPMLNTTPPSQVQNSSSAASTTTPRNNNQTLPPATSSNAIVCPSTFHGSILPPTTVAPTTQQQQSFGLKYPTVSMQASGIAGTNPSFTTNAQIISMQVVNINTTCLQPNDCTNSEELYNFAPVATFRSDTISPAQLSLLNQNIDLNNKRNRNPPFFSYRFPPKKQYFDLTMVLPYKIVLHEVIVKAPEPSGVSNAPSSVQVELSTDPALASWQALSCPVCSDNPLYYRLSTSSYRLPVTGVRLHLGCPSFSSTLNLAQIQLLGSTSIKSMRFLSNSTMFESQVVYHWVSLFSRLCKRIDVPIWSYALCIRSLIKVYLSEEHQKDTFRQIYELLSSLNERLPTTEQPSLVQMIVDYLSNGGRICPKAYISVAELLYASCLPAANATYHQRFGAENRLSSPSDQVAILRQRELITGICMLLNQLVPDESIDEKNWIPEAVRELSVLIWAASCVIWHNSSDEKFRYDTIALCLEVGPSIIPKLTKFVTNLHDITLYRASCWLLCTLARTSSEQLTKIFDCLGLNDCTADEYTIPTMRILGKVCQSSSAAKFLIDKKLLSIWSTTAIEIAREKQDLRMQELISIVDLFCDLVVIDVVADYFGNHPNGELLFRSLIRYAISSTQTEEAGEKTSRAASPEQLLLLSSVINFVKRCLSSVDQRKRVAKIISDLLKIMPNTQKGKQLPTAFLDVIMKLIVDDEKILIRLTGVTQHSVYTTKKFEDAIIFHPLFGCTQDDRVLEVPLSMACHELLPHIKKQKLLANRASKMIPYDDFSFASNTLKMVFSSDDMDDKEVVPPPKDTPESSKTVPEYPYLYKQYAVQLVSDTFSSKHALNNKWSLETVWNGLKSIQQRPSNAMDVDLSTSLSADSNYNDGYFTLTLRVKTSTQTSLLPLVEDEPAYSQQLKDINLEPSTLLCFAKCEGLKFLSRSVDVLTRVDEKLKSIVDSMKKLPDNYEMAKKEISSARDTIKNSSLRLTCNSNEATSSSNKLDPYQLLYNSMEKPVLNVYNALQLLQKQGVPSPEPDQIRRPGAAQAYQPKFSGPSSVLNYDLFDTIDGIPMGSAEEEMLSTFDFMSEATSASSPKTITSKPGSSFKPLAPSSSQAIGLLSAVPTEEEWMGMVDASNGFAPINMAITTNIDPNQDFYGQITNQLQSQLNYLQSEIANKTQALNSSALKDAYLLKMPMNMPAAKRPRCGSISSSHLMEFNEHIMIALSLFFEIDTYGQTFVEYDAQAAKRLIRSFLCVPPSTITETASPVVGLTPLLPQAQSQDMDTAKEGWKKSGSKSRYADLYYDDLMPTSLSALYANKSKKEESMLAPFVALARCFENAAVSKVGADEATRIRMQAMNNGTIDVLLTLLSHYSNQRPQFCTIRPTGDLVVTQLMSRLFLFYPDVQTVFKMFNEPRQKPISNFGKVPFAAPKALPSQSGKVGPSSASIVFGGMGSSSTNKDYWAKGTGFGSGTTASTWSLTNHLSQKKQDEVFVTHLLNILTNFIKPQPIASTYRVPNNSDQSGGEIVKTDTLNEDLSPLPLIPSNFVEMIKRSCLSINLSTSLMNDSVLDISNHAPEYEAVVGLLMAICSSDSIVQINEHETMPLSHLIIHTAIDTPGSSVYDRLKQMVSVLNVYISKLGKSNEPSTSEAAKFKQQEESLSDLLKVGNIVIQLMEKRNETRQDAANEDEKMDEQRQHEIVLDLQGYTTGRSLEYVYMETLKPFQYDTVNFFNVDGNTTLFPYHYSSNTTAMAQVGGGMQRFRRLAQESSSLLNSLPLSSSSSVFVCVAEERLDVMKVLLTGPIDTPYSGGCFEFDVFFPNDYPNVPMQMNLQTTGSRTVRFNPNLYDDGKVCLSILNTWSGRPEERWNPTTSSFLQVLVSIQSLILVEEPFFNEPGFERTRNTPSGDQSSRDYTANIRHQCIRWAMIEQLRKPPVPFTKVIQTHFWLKRDEICLQIQEWIRETKELITKHPMAKALPSHLTLMEKHFETLLAEFAKMESPTGLDHCKSKFVREYLDKKQQK